MSYAAALSDLVGAASEVDLAIALETPEGDAARLCETVFGPALAAEIIQQGYPKTFDIPWIVEDLPAFLHLLATWIRYFVAEHGANLDDENSEVPEATRAEIRRDVLGALPEADKDAVLSFLLAD